MIVIADNDIIIKLAKCNLLSEFSTWLDAPPSQVWVLPALKFWIRNKLKNNNHALSCFEKFLLITQDVPVVKTATLEIFTALDAGEQQLLAVFYEQIEYPRLVTGDKRALRQLAEISKQDSLLCAKLDGQVDCLEGIMLGLIQSIGFDAISCKIVAGVDGVLDLAFGAARNQQHTVSALKSNLTALRADALFVKAR